MYYFDSLAVVEPARHGRPMTARRPQSSSRPNWCGDVLVTIVAVLAILIMVDVVAGRALGSQLLGFAIAGLLFVVGASIQRSLAGSPAYPSRRGRTC